jgi:hypothetical protein
MNLKVYNNILKGILEQMQGGDYVSAEENIIKIIATVNNLEDYDNRNDKEKTKGK